MNAKTYILAEEVSTVHIHVDNDTQEQTFKLEHFDQTSIMTGESKSFKTNNNNSSSVRPALFLQIGPGGSSFGRLTWIGETG